MRKIDAVLLSALIIYDYSAQSLVDSDSYSLGQTLASETSTLQENSPAGSLFSENLVEGEDNTIRSVKRINALPASVRSENTISYHELTNVNSTAVNNAQTEQEVTIDAITEENVTNNTDAVTVEEVIVENVAEVTHEVAAVESKVATYAVETVNTSKETSVADPASIDTDSDGIYDYEDKCQGTAGVARFEGCPVPDSDADGVNDEEDRCPAEAGTIENGGCPVVALENIPVVEAATVITNEVKEQKNDVKRFNNQIGLSFNGSVLTNEDFNIVLQFADVLIRQQEAKIEVSATKDNTNINYLVAYLKELGVNNKQVVVSTKGNDSDLDRSKVYMHLKF